MSTPNPPPPPPGPTMFSVSSVVTPLIDPIKGLLRTKKGAVIVFAYAFATYVVYRFDASVLRETLLFLGAVTAAYLLAQAGEDAAKHHALATVTAATTRAVATVAQTATSSASPPGGAAS